MEEKTLLESKLKAAIEMARTRYHLENRSIWARITEGIASILWSTRKPKSQ